MARFFGTFADAMSIRFDRLTDREKKLVLLLLAVFLVLVVGGGFFWINASLGEKTSQLHSMQRRMDEIIALQDQFQQAKVKQEAEERRFKFNTVSLFSLIQTAASRYGLQLYDLSEKKEPVGETKLVETNVVVNLREVSIDRLTAFLQAIEESSESGVVKVTKLKVKTRYDKSDLLDVQMTVSTWKTA